MLSRNSGAALSDRCLEMYLIEQHQQCKVKAQCIVVYRFPLQQDKLMQLVRQKEWKLTAWDYDPDHQTLEISALDEPNSRTRQDVTNLV